MKNVSPNNLRTCIHLSQREFEEIIGKIYAGAVVNTDPDTPWLLCVSTPTDNIDYYDVEEDLANYFDIRIRSYHAETGSDGAYDVWIDYV